MVDPCISAAILQLLNIIFIQFIILFFFVVFFQVHFPSLTNFSNWPIERQTLGNVSCIGFSTSSGYMGVGNEKGQALLFR